MYIHGSRVLVDTSCAKVVYKGHTRVVNFSAGTIDAIQVQQQSNLVLTSVLTSAARDAQIHTMKQYLRF
jgi:hypothetical protein